MKNFKKIASLVFAVAICAVSALTVSADVNTVDGSILDFKPLKGDVNIDGYLDLRDIVRFKKYSVDDSIDFDTEVADFDGVEGIGATDLAGLQDAVIAGFFG